MFTNFTRVRELFLQAASVEPERREAWLKDACQGDSALLAQLNEMLSAAEPDTQTQSQPAAQAELLGNYRLSRELGRGGMGIVYLATRNDGTFRKNVALKVLLRGLVSPELILRFKQERQVMAALDHPNIARILDGGDTGDGMPWYAMEYVEGLPLDKYCDEHRLSIAARIEIFQQVCRAVEYLHQNSVLHRDLKPSNILVSSEGAVKVLDFGIARFVGAAAIAGEDLSNIHSRPMTPLYASPEQISGATLKKTSDVYSLGVILYRLLTGRTPWESYDQKVAKLTAYEDPPPPSDNVEENLGAKRETTAQLRRSMAGELDSIVLMAMRHDPKRRYQAAAELADDLGRYLEGRTVVAHHDSMAVRSVKLLKRKRVAAAVLAGFLVLGGFGLWQLRRVTAIREVGASQEAHLRDLLAGLEARLSSSIGEPSAKLVQQRIEDVRALRKAFSVDFPAAVVRRAGHALELDALLERGIRYLDNVRNASPPDARLVLEMSGAYEELGLLEEKSPYSNAYNKQKAIRSYQESAALVEGIAMDAPSRRRLEALNQRIKDLGGTPVLIMTSATPDQIRAMSAPPRRRQTAASTTSGEPPPAREIIPIIPILPLDNGSPLPVAGPVNQPTPALVAPAAAGPANQPTPAPVAPAAAGVVHPTPPVPAETSVAPISEPTLRAREPLAVPPSTAKSDKMNCGGSVIVQNSERVFRNLPLHIDLDYDKKKWKATLEPVDDQSQRLILKNISSGPLTDCKVKWTRTPESKR
jgi:hypothetical protein